MNTISFQGVRVCIFFAYSRNIISPILTLLTNAVRHYVPLNTVSSTSMLNVGGKEDSSYTSVSKVFTTQISAELTVTWYSFVNTSYTELYQNQVKNVENSPR